MHPSVASAINSLEPVKDNLANHIPNDQPLNTLWGWNMPSLTRSELIDFVDETQQCLRDMPEKVSDRDRAALDSTPTRIQYWQSSVLPNLQGGNAIWAVLSLRDELERLNRLAAPYIALPPPPPPAPDWEKMAAEGLLPSKLATRLTSMQTRMNRLAPRFDELESRVKIIDQAYETADKLPETIASLEEGRRELATARTEAQSLAASAATHAREAADSKSNIDALAEQAAAKYAELESAYRAAATKGLASAFQQRAVALGWSVRMWVSVLVLDLAAGAWVGYLRFHDLQKILSSPQSAPVIWGNLVFSLLSIAAPVWLGWVATKQINQRFKLAEDYGFKATVASAYEAWKTEAQKQDPQFGQRLFGSALSRLEEAPLRFVEAENYGSPWHEFVRSPAFAKAVDSLPDLKAAYAKFVATSAGAAAAAGAVITALGANVAPKAKANDIEEAA